MPDSKGKPYDFEIAKALHDLHAAHQILVKGGFKLAIAIEAQKPVSIPVSPEVFASVSCTRLQVEPVEIPEGAYWIHKMLSDHFSICTHVKRETTAKEAEEREAA